MSYIKKVSILFSYIFIFILLTGNRSVSADIIFPIKTDVDYKKIWTITFNKEINPVTIRNSIYVIDKDGIKPNINLVFGDSYKTLNILPPDEGYKYGQTYYIIVGKNVETKDATKIKDSIKMEFSVTKNSNTVDTIRTKSNSVVYVEAIDEDNQQIKGGSGFIFFDRVITNYHLIDRAIEATITLMDGTKLYVGGIYSFDKDKDIAILKISGSKLPTVYITDSDKLELGENVIAIECSNEGDSKVTSGKVVRINKNVFSNGIEVSDTENSWSGGGPLFNHNGEVIGMTTLSGNSDDKNIQYAIPINKLKEYLNSYRVISFQKMKEEVYPFILPDGARYSGPIYDGKANGYGTAIYDNGDKYVGYLVDNYMDGYGTYYYINGDKYVGSFKNGKKEGYGTFTSYDGRYKYIGEYKEGKKSGKGTLYYDGVVLLSGSWNDDQFLGEKLNPPRGVKTKSMLSGIQVGWDEVLDAEYYYVYYSDNYGGPYSCIFNSDGTKKKFYWITEYPCAELNLKSGTTRYYKVTSVKNEVESDYSNVVSAYISGS